MNLVSAAADNRCRVIEIETREGGGEAIRIALAANFAVLNHVHDLRSLLGLLASHLRPGGALVASLLNPLYKGEMRWRGWCKLQLMSQWSGAVTLRGEVSTYRPYLRTLRRMAKPHLALVEVGHIDEHGNWSRESVSWREIVRQQFHFVVLQRQL